MKQISITKIKPHPLNAKIYNPEGLEDIITSISNVGLLDPIVILKDHTIISGHRRYYACLELGMKKVSVEVKDIPKDEVPLILVSYNTQRVKGASEILNEIEVIKKYVRKNKTSKGKHSRRFIADKIKIPESMIAKLLVVKKKEPNLIKRVDDGVLTISAAYQHVLKMEKVRKHQETIAGTQKRLRRRPIIEGKDYTLFNSSSASMKHVDSNSVQTIFTSPPFYNRRTYGNHKGEIGREKTWEEYLKNMKEVFSNCWRVLNDKGSMFIEMGDNIIKGRLQLYPHKFLLELLEWDDWVLQNTIIWNKTNLIKQGHNRFSPSHSYIFFLTKKTKGYTFDKKAIQIYKDMNPHDKPRPMGRIHSAPGTTLEPNVFIPSPYSHMGDVWDIHTSSVSVAKDLGIDITHPAAFPPHLVRIPVIATSKVGDLVLDPFSGLGTTGLTALENGRRYIGFDTCPKFNEVARVRLNNVRKNHLKLVS